MKKPVGRLLYPNTGWYFAAMLLFTAAAAAVGQYILAGGALFVTLIMFIISRARLSRRKRQLMSYVQTATDSVGISVHAGSAFPMAVIRLPENEIIWGNPSFFTITGLSDTACYQTLDAVVPGFSTSWLREGRSELPGDQTIGGRRYPIYGNYIGEKKGKTYYYYDYVLRKSYYYVHTTTAQGSQVAVVMGHNNRKKVGTSNSYFHNLHHIQNAILGKSSCEKCKASCSGYGKSISASWEGSSSWEVVAFFEVPKNKAYKNILPQMAQPWNYTTAQYLSNVKSYVNTFSSKSWANTSALTDNGKYMMLVTCGDSGDNDSIAKLYMLLKAVG